jgi:hypothetical protein
LSESLTKYRLNCSIGANTRLRKSALYNTNECTKKDQPLSGWGNGDFHSLDTVAGMLNVAISLYDLTIFCYENFGKTLAE